MKKINEILPSAIIRILSLFTVIAMIFIFVFVFSKAMPVLRNSGVGLITNTGFDSQIRTAFSSADEPMLEFGLLGLIAGTVFSTAAALVTAVVLSIGAAVAISELAHKKAAVVLTAFVRLLASVPSVIFGLVGIMTVVPFIEEHIVTVDLQIEFLDFFQMSGRNLLSSIVVLSFMIVPTIISLCISAFNTVPNERKEVGFAFGMSRFRVIWKIVIPSARSGIIAGIILGAGRGIGEAIAVSMVCGGVGNIPKLSHGFAALLTPVLPLSAAIINKSEAMSVASVESALFACGAVLLIFGALLSVGAKIVENRLRRMAGYDD
ncbi:MAG: phosphate ABC transporter permease subunit PstC [Oscillospiraceae bacterium]|nr:phosphate ABC transporter permease subunit PstC [Oscillospiraceae bacterium]